MAAAPNEEFVPNAHAIENMRAGGARGSDEEIANLLINAFKHYASYA
jgi:hypothetical protein